MLDRDELLAQVARDYYEDHLTQDEIGRRISASRSTVSRLLQQAADRGIVRILIDYPWSAPTIWNSVWSSVFICARHTSC